MKRVKRLAVMGAIAGTMMISAGFASAQTLKTALADAYRESGLLEQNRALLRAADEDVAIAISQLRPIIQYSATAAQAYSDTEVTAATNGLSSSISLTGSLLLYDSGRTEIGVESAKANVLATRQSLVSIEQQVLFRAVTAYMNLRRDRSTLDLQRNNYRLLQEELRAAQERFEVGEITRTDVALAESRLSASASGVASAEASVAASEAEYLAAVGKRPGSLSNPPATPEPVRNVNEAKARGLRAHPDIRSAQQSVTVSELNLRAAELAVSPSVSLNSTLSRGLGNEPGDDTTGASLGVTVSGPIYQGGQISALRRQAAAQRDASRSVLHITRLGIEQNVSNAWAQLQASKASQIATREQVRAAQIAFDGTREEAALGSRTTLDVLDAEQELLNARSAAISADADRQIAAYQLLQSMGMLTAERLGLDVPLYDPESYYNLARNAPTAASPRGRQLDRVLQQLGTR